MLIKVRAVGKEREEIKRMADIFRGHIVDVTDKAYTIELTGNQEKIEAFIGALDRSAILETVRVNEAGPVGVLIAICIAFFIACMFVDPIVVILVLTPIFAPAIQATGLDPVLVGVLITLQVAIGSATPPFGCDIFTAIAIFKRPYMEVIRGTPPFIFMLVAAAGLIIAFPDIALFLRDLAYRD